MQKFLPTTLHAAKVPNGQWNVHSFNARCRERQLIKFIFSFSAIYVQFWKMCKWSIWLNVSVIWGDGYPQANMSWVVCKIQERLFKLGRQATYRQTEWIRRWGAAIAIARKCKDVDHELVKTFISRVMHRLHALGDIQKISMWVPYTLIDHKVGQWLGTCKALLQRFDWKNLLWKKVTGYEKWVYSDNPASKLYCVDPGQPTTSTAKTDI